MTVWLRIAPDEGNAIDTAASVLAERGYLAQAQELERIADRWRRRQARRFDVLSRLRLERFA